MTVKAKFTVSRVSEFGAMSGGRQEIVKVNTESGKYESIGVPVREVTLYAVYDDGISKENASFAEATPSGTITFTLNNPTLINEFKPGDTYYVEFTRK